MRSGRQRCEGVSGSDLVTKTYQFSPISTLACLNFIASSPIYYKYVTRIAFIIIRDQVP